MLKHNWIIQSNITQRLCRAVSSFLVLCYRLPRQLHNHTAWNKTEASQVDISGLEPSCTSWWCTLLDIFHVLMGNWWGTTSRVPYTVRLSFERNYQLSLLLLWQFLSLLRVCSKHNNQKRHELIKRLDEGIVNGTVCCILRWMAHVRTIWAAQLNPLCSPFRLKQLLCEIFLISDVITWRCSARLRETTPPPLHFFPPRAISLPLLPSSLRSSMCRTIVAEEHCSENRWNQLEIIDLLWGQHEAIFSKGLCNINY